MTGGRLDNDLDALDPEAVRALWELLGGDREALAELVDSFLEEAPRCLSDVRAGADRGDAALARRGAHSLKANALTFGALELASLCRRLEAAAREDELGGERALIDRADAEWTRVREHLTTLRDRGRP